MTLTDLPNWKPGDQIVLREVWRGRVWSGRPVIVVEDSPDLLALYMPTGTGWKKPTTPHGGRLRMPAEDWALVDDRQPVDALSLVTPAAAHSVRLFWSQGHTRFEGWYVNLEDPLRRSLIGFDYMDQILDIVISPDLSEWRWKDEDELQEAQALGIIAAEKARMLRAEGEQVVARMQVGGPPFSDGWEHWRPDPAWPVPQLPDGWDVLG